MKFIVEFVLSDERGRTGSIFFDPDFHDLPDQVKSLCTKMKLGESFTVRLVDESDTFNIYPTL